MEPEERAFPLGRRAPDGFLRKVIHVGRRAQALRDIDLITSQGQTILVFVGITGLIVPLLVLVIAPIGLVIAVSYAIHKLNSDSEIVVMNAAGMSPWRMFRPFLAVAVVVSLLVLGISAYLAPQGLRELRDWSTRVRTDVVANIVQPGRFTSIEHGLIFHIRERHPNGQLVGIFMDDRRSASERSTFLAEYGEIVANGGNTFLILVNGSVQRLETGKLDPTIILFDRYAFDMSRLGSSSQNQGPLAYGVRERYLWDLASPDPADSVYVAAPGQFRAEFHDRLVAPIYPIAFVAIAFAILGAPRTTRQSRGFSLGLAIVCVMLLRMIGFACAAFAVHMPAAIVVMYAALAAAFVLSYIAISRGALLEPPAALTRAMDAFAEHFARRAGPVTGSAA